MKKYNRSEALEGLKTDKCALKGYDLSNADLISANLEGANLEGAILVGAILVGAILEGANLEGACIDFSSLPLWCGSLKMIVDKEISCQIAYHFCKLECEDDEVKAAQKLLATLANQFHRADECGRIEVEK